MSNASILRVTLYQPSSHYRMPFAKGACFTYMIPPYSTVIGLLCNILSIRDQRQDSYKKLKQIKLSIAGKYDDRIVNLTWTRNMHITRHKSRFGNTSTSTRAGIPEHPGGIVPTHMHELINAKIILHIAHEDPAFLQEIKNNLLDSTNHISTIHLGRAHDMVDIQEVSDIYNISHLPVMRRDGDYQHYFWIPQYMYWPTPDMPPDYATQFKGMPYTLTTFWKVPNFEKTYNREARRIFEYMPAVLSTGVFVNKKFLFDEECKLPVFLADFSRCETTKQCL